MSFFENTRKPVGLGGKLMVAMMNLGHSPVAQWGLRFLRLAPNAKVLDCGCGGGANIKRLLKKCPHGVVKGVDYSPVSVEKTKSSTELQFRRGVAPSCKAVWRIWRLRIATSMPPRPLRPSIFGLICPDVSVRSGGR